MAGRTCSSHSGFGNVQQSNRQVSYQEHYVNMGQPGATSRKEHYHHPRAAMDIAFAAIDASEAVSARSPGNVKKRNKKARRS